MNLNKGFEGSKPPEYLMNKNYEIVTLNPLMDDITKVKYFKEFMNTGKIKNLNINPSNSYMEATVDEHIGSQVSNGHNDSELQLKKKPMATDTRRGRRKGVQVQFPRATTINQIDKAILMDSNLSSVRIPRISIGKKQ